MKVTYISRPRRDGAFSIETEFNTVKAAIKDQVIVDDFVHDPKRSILKSVLELRGRRSDVYHVAGDVHYYAIFLPRERTVLTVHDIGHYTNTLKGFKKLVYKFIWLTAPLKLAKIVTVISEETKKLVVRHFPGSANKISVVGCPYPMGLKYVPRKFNDQCPVILQVGVSDYKNVPRLIEALKGIPCKLVLIGSLSKPIIEKLNANGIVYENRHNISDEELLRHYADCDMVSFVSTGEGFGMPIIEANAVGRPLITAKIPPMSDVAGPAACLVDPLDIADIRRGILKIIQDPQYREMLVAEGLENCKRFSAQRIAGEYLKLYSTLCGTRGES